HRDAGGQRLDEDDAEGLEIARQDQRVCGPHLPASLASAERSHELDALTSQITEAAALFTGADDDQFRSWMIAAICGERAKKKIDPFTSHQITDEKKNERRRRTLGTRRPKKIRVDAIRNYHRVSDTSPQ